MSTVVRNNTDIVIQIIPGGRFSSKEKLECQPHETIEIDDDRIVIDGNGWSAESQNQKSVSVVPSKESGGWSVEID